MSSSSGTHLTTSRISRIFRPLRAKCATLAEFSPTAPARKHTLVSVTYAQNSRPASRTSSIEQDTPPLAILQPPETLGSRIHLDRTSVQNLQLSRKIYEVRDAFRNLLQVAFGTGSRNEPKRTRIMGLAAMCSVVVGEHIQSELRACEEDESVEDENASATLMDELYEAIPPHYRRYAVASHALSLVLDVCPHHPTLLTALLDVCLGFDLISESRHILRALLTAAITPGATSAAACPLAHPAHSNYLTTLRSTCRTNDKRGLGLDEHTFVAVLVEVLLNSTLFSVNAWTSKAVSRLAKELSVQDLRAYIKLCVGLAHKIAQTEQAAQRQRVHNRKGESSAHSVQEDPLRRRLRTWTLTLLDQIRNWEAMNSTSDAPCPDFVDEHQCCVDFLVQASSLGLHTTTTLYIAPTLSDALICTASLCIAAPALSSLPSTDFRALEEMLVATSPKSETYDALVSPLFSPRSSPDETTPMSVTPTPPPDTISPSPSPQGMQALHVYARALGSRRLYHLEASILSNALRHIENILLTSNNLPFFKQPMSTGDMDSIRRELVQYIESAEARCFGSRTGGTGHGPPAGGAANMGRGAVPGGGSGNRWVWEETMGCWAPESPVIQRCEQRAPKRRRLSCDHPSTDSVAEGRILRFQSRSQESRRTARHSLPALNVAKVVSRGRESMPSRRASVLARHDDVAGSDEFEAQLGSPVTRTLQPRTSKKLDQENVPPKGSKAASLRPVIQRSQTKQPMRRLTNFDTLLADAHKNCIVLHPKKPNDEEARKSQTHRRAGKGDLTPGDDFATNHHLSSDDALDLFAYQSSPVAPRRMR